MNTAAETVSLVSLGKLCEILQRGPAEIRRAIADAGLTASLVLNGVDHFSEDAITTLRERFATQPARPR